MLISLPCSLQGKAALTTSEWIRQAQGSLYANAIEAANRQSQ